MRLGPHLSLCKRHSHSLSLLRACVETLISETEERILSGDVTIHFLLSSYIEFLLLARSPSRMSPVKIQNCQLISDAFIFFTWMDCQKISHLTGSGLLTLTTYHS